MVLPGAAEAAVAAALLKPELQSARQKSPGSGELRWDAGRARGVVACAIGRKFQVPSPCG